MEQSDQGQDASKPDRASNAPADAVAQPREMGKTDSQPDHDNAPNMATGIKAQTEDEVMTESQPDNDHTPNASADARAQPEETVMTESHTGSDRTQHVDEQVIPEHVATADLLSLVSWGDGSAPSEPSVASSEAALSDQSDTDSAVGSFRSSTMSLRSSVYDYIEENGRTYHRYKEGKYVLPNDQVEQERLDLQHALFLLSTGGKQFFAPIKHDVGHILDFATGTGIWAIEIAQMFPGATVIGTDLSPIQPIYVPPNCHFEIDDAEDEWTFSTKFDFIHGRALITCFKDPKSVIQSAFDSLAPGGWLELQDAYFPLGFEEGRDWSHTALWKWSQLMVEGSTKTGRPWIHAQYYKQYMEEIGFEDVHEKRLYWPMSPWAKGKYYKGVAEFCQADFLNGVEGMSLKILGFLGWSREEIAVFVAQVRRDLKDTSIHAWLNILVVYGRRPS